MDELKPCPFCGGEAEVQEIGAAPDMRCVRCLKCGAKSIFVHYLDGKIAIKKWNKRVDD